MGDVESGSHEEPLPLPSDVTEKDSRGSSRGILEDAEPSSAAVVSLDGQTQNLVPYANQYGATLPDDQSGQMWQRGFPLGLELASQIQSFTEDQKTNIIDETVANAHTQKAFVEGLSAGVKHGQALRNVGVRSPLKDQNPPQVRLLLFF